MCTFVLTCFLSLLIARSCSGQNSIADTIGFPEAEENPELKNKENRQPVYIPSRCPENELLYPGDQKDDWICDCRPSHIYQPASDKCWPAYRQGPCQTGQFLVLPLNTYLPACVPNPCKHDMMVPFNGGCQRLGSVEPCRDLLHPSALEVNATTLIVSCVKLNVELRFGEETTPVCLPGRKTNVNRRCNVVPT